MVMEALEGYSERIKYDIVGHSGEDNDIPFVPILKAPDNDMERLKVEIVEVEKTNNPKSPLAGAEGDARPLPVLHVWRPHTLCEVTRQQEIVHCNVISAFWQSTRLVWLWTTTTTASSSSFPTPISTAMASAPSPSARS